MLYMDLPPVVSLQGPSPPAYQFVMTEKNYLSSNQNVLKGKKLLGVETGEKAFNQAIQSISDEKILQSFLDLVKIPSPSGQEEQVRAYILDRLQQMNLGASATVDDAGNILLTLPSNVQSDKTVLLTVHMDVVPPCLDVKPIVEGVGDQRVIRSSGDTVLGGDDKAAIAALLEALEMSIRYDLPRPNLIIPITVREEIGGLGAADIDPKTYSHADLAIALDCNEPIDTVIYAAPQLTLFEAVVDGQSAHSGFEPEKGANAIQALTLAVSKFRQGRINAETTANVGTISGGRKFNIVPDQAVAKGEVRSLEKQGVETEIEDMRQKLDQAVREVPGTRYELKLHTVIEGYQTDLNLPIFQPLKQSIQEAGFTLRTTKTHGGSDVNVFAHSGVPSVVLSGAYHNPHQVDEYVELRDMTALSRLLLTLLKNYAK